MKPVENVCRLCLEENCATRYHSLKDEHSKSFKAFADIFRFKPNEHSTFPQKACDECHMLMMNFYEFYLDVMKNQGKLLLEARSVTPTVSASPEQSNIVDNNEVVVIDDDDSDGEIPDDASDNLSGFSENATDALANRITPKHICSRCNQQFNALYLLETHTETEHCTHPIDAPPSIKVDLVISESILLLKCKYCPYKDKNQSMWDTRRHQASCYKEIYRSVLNNGLPLSSSSPTVNLKPSNGTQPLTKVLSHDAVAERVQLIKASKKLTDTQKIKIFYGLTCTQCIPNLNHNTFEEFEQHCLVAHNRSSVSFFCCKVKWAGDRLIEHLNCHLSYPLVVLKPLESQQKKKKTQTSAASSTTNTTLDQNPQNPSEPGSEQRKRKVRASTVSPSKPASGSTISGNFLLRGQNRRLRPRACSIGMYKV